SRHLTTRPSPHRMSGQRQSHITPTRMARRIATTTRAMVARAEITTVAPVPVVPAAVAGVAIMATPTRAAITARVATTIKADVATVAAEVITTAGTFQSPCRARI